MNCQQVRQLLHAYVDGELDLVRNVEVEDHLKGCTECSKLDKGVRSLRSTIATQAPYFRAPRELCVVPESTFANPKNRRHFFTGNLATTLALSLLIGAISFSGGLFLNSGQSNQRLADAIVAAHVRSLQVEHAVDVVSSDRHTVKPWFQGKLDYAPQVIDLSKQGFKLHGGRLDYLIDRPIAAVFYYRRSHAINVFTWPAISDKDAPVRKKSTQGFHIRSWQQSGMTYWVISDLNDVELDEFVNSLREIPPQPTGGPE